MKKICFAILTMAMLTGCQESLEERAAREAQEVTESKCPMLIGNNMYLDSIVFDIPTLTQSSYYRFIGDTDSDSTIPRLKNAKAILVSELKNTPQYKTLMSRGVNFRFVYRSTKNPNKIYVETTLTKEDYQ